MTEIKTEDKVKEAKTSSRLFGMLFVFCLIASGLGFYWYLTTLTRPFGLLACAAALLVLAIGGLYGWSYYNNKAGRIGRKG